MDYTEKLSKNIVNVKKMDILYFISTRILIAITFFKQKFEDHIFGHQSKTIDPKYIDIEIGLIIKPIE